MPLDGTANDKSFDSDAKLIILCPDDREQAIRKVLTRYAGAFWEGGEIELLSFARNTCRDAKRVTAALKDALNHSTAIRHIIRYKGIRFDENYIRTRAFVFDIPSAKSLEEETLPKILKSLGIDWLSFIERRLSGRWRHGVLNRQHLEDWIEQCRKLGNHAWVAERILKLVDFWSDDRLRTQLRITAEGLQDFDSVCINRFLPGKSADAISNLIQKQIEATVLKQKFSRVVDFAEAVDSETAQSVLFVEDCLITGNEMVRVLMALQGQKDTFGGPRARKLKRPEFLRSKRICLRFAVATNGGLLYLKRYLDREQLYNIEVDAISTDAILNVLTPEGLLALENDSFFDDEGCLVNPELHISREAFAPLKWRNKETRDRAIAFCAEIGRQLYGLYLESENKEWPKKRIAESALGVRSFALTLAFQHSVPKETLPLLWYRGQIAWMEKQLRWLSLFQNAA
jgi:hypothetical protein